MATLHFICGKAGAGKTTLARALGRTVPAVVFCEDEWFATLGLEIHGIDDLRNAMAKVRGVIGPLTIEMLRLGVSVVWDFAGNTVKHRQWARGIFEAAGAEHILHVIEASDEACLAGIRQRNAQRPVGVYYGDVSEEMFHAVTAYFAPPQPEEGFLIQVHARAGA
jgi:predicted kinase